MNEHLGENLDQTPSKAKIKRRKKDDYARRPYYHDVFDIASKKIQRVIARLENACLKMASLNLKAQKRKI